ncbi:hypothetical protein Q3G72_003136 [Acer saccharum]|nr:hypothetical protein Q3G72_003136 [Acer saccharum]
MQQSSLSVSSSLSLPSLLDSKLTIRSKNMNLKCSRRNSSPPLILCCSDTSSSSTARTATTTSNGIGPPVLKKRKRYRKEYPGENEGITEEMRFVAMRLCNIKGKKIPFSYLKIHRTTTTLKTKKMIRTKRPVNPAWKEKLDWNEHEDLEWFSEQGIIIPEPSTPGVSYAKYLEELA